MKEDIELPRNDHIMLESKPSA